MNHRIVSLALPILVAAMTACNAGGPTNDAQRAGESAPSAPTTPPPRGASGPLDAAHKAYLEGDFTAVAERIRDVLLDPASNDLVKENAYALLDKSYEVNGGRLPATSTMPAGYADLQYGVVRGIAQHGAPFYKLFARGRTRDASHIKGFTVKRLPDQVLLDKQAKKGTFDLRDDEPGYKDFVIELEDLSSAPPDGVYTMRLELDDGTVGEGWFIAHGLTSSASPEVKTPLPSATLSDPNPLVTWVPFRSPEYLPFEERTLNVWVSLQDDDKSSWNLWTGDPKDLSSVRLGDHPGFPSAKLAKGDHWLSLGMGELRRFGPIRIVRNSVTVLPFHLQ